VELANQLVDLKFDIVTTIFFLEPLSLHV
jgi:hypothetical protein